MSVRLTILCDNSVSPRPDLIGEHGFACHIATDKRQYLFDTGNGLGLIDNARACNIDLTQIDAVLLSHGHWDHCGGLLKLLNARAGRPTPVYAHPAIFEEKISCGQEGQRVIGSGFTRAAAEAAGAIFSLSANPVDLGEGLLFSGQIPRHITNNLDTRLCHRQRGKLSPDPLDDDQSLYLQTRSGLTVLCGCAHAGVRNILAHACKLTGTDSLHGLVGGLHLMFAEDEQQSLIINDLQQHDIQLIAAAHCTGPHAVGQLMNIFGESAIAASVGCQIQL